MGGVPGIFFKILNFYTFAALVITGATYSYYLSFKHNFGWKVKTGYDPDDSRNVGFYVNFSAVGFAIISFLYAIIEILSLFKVKFAKVLDQVFVKAIIYLVDGIAVLGLCGDLGISAGSLTIIAAGIWIICGIIEALD